MSDEKNCKKEESHEPNIWCTTCGDTSSYNPEIRWHIKDDERGIGICSRCAKVLDKENLVLPDQSEDGYATFT